MAERTRAAAVHPRVIRVFVSSTFRDMHAERDYLNRFVFPELRSRCLRRAVEFVGVDLRWGITQQEAEQQGALALCLEEIDRCRPFFVALLGDRYGWVPPPDDIPRTFFENARNDASLQAEDVARLHDWYHLDETVQPSRYSLRRDRQIPPCVAEALNRFWGEAGLLRAEESITAQEIDHALSGGPKTHALFYLRRSGVHTHPDFPPSFVPRFEEQNPDRRAKLADSKRAIRAQAGPPVRDYAVDYDGLRIDPTLLPADMSAMERESLQDGVVQPEEWPVLSQDVQTALNEHGTVALRGLEEWGEQILGDLWQVIETELETSDAPLDDHAQERAYHERFLAERTDLFYGREELLKRLLAYVAGQEDREPLVVTGPPGSGKSALMAECARRCRAQYADALVLPHFIGVAPGSTALTGTIRSLCETLRRECGLADEIPTDPEELCRQLAVFLEKAGEQRRVVLLLDAINQLDPAGQSHELYWFPFRAPAGTRVIVSTLAGPCLGRLVDRVPPDHVVEVPALPKGDRKTLIRERLARRGKKLTPHQISRLLDTDARPDAGLPLYLLVAVEELCLFGDYDTLNRRIERLPATLPELFDQVLARLEHDHSRTLTESILRWLAASRAGLLEVEILDLLESDASGFSRLRWTRFYRALEFYLRRMDETSGAGLLSFYHDQLRFAVYRRYFEMDTPGSLPSESLRETHCHLAGYFRSIVDGGGDTPAWRTDRPRGLGELPYHQAGGELWDELVETLTSFGFVQAKVEVFGPQPLIEDYDLTLTRGNPYSLDTAEGLRMIQGALRLSTHILAQDRSQLAGQLLGRLAAGDSPTLQTLLAQAGQWKAAPWLRPLIPSLTAPVGPLLRTFQGHTDWVNGVAVTPDNRRVISASRDRTLRIWDLATAQKVRTLQTHTASIEAVAVIPDGHYAISTSRDQTLKVWDITSGHVQHTFRGHTDWVNAVAVTPDGRYAVSASNDQTLKVWDLASGREHCPLQGHGDKVNAVAVTPDGRYAVSASDDETLIVWDIVTGQKVRCFRGHATKVKAVAVTPDGRCVVSGAYKTLKMWDLNNGQELCTLQGHIFWVNALTVTPDGRHAISASADWTLKIWDLASGRELGTLQGHTSAAKAVAVTLDGRYAISASDDETLKVWDIAGGRERGTHQGHASSVNAVAVTPDGRYAVSASDDKTLKVWDVTSGRQVHILQGHIHWVSGVTVTPDSRYAISASVDKTLRVWDLASGQEQHTLEKHEGLISAVVVTPDGRRAISASYDQTLKVWDLASGQELHVLEGHSALVNAVTVTSDGRYAVSASDDNELKVWDVARGKEVHTLRGHTGPVKAVAVIPGGSYAISTSVDKTPRVWDIIAGGQAVHTLQEHADEVNAVTVTPDGRYAISASIDKTLKVWDIAAGQAVHTLRGHVDEVNAVTVTPDGRYVISVSTDKTLRVWDLDSGRNIVTFSCEGALYACAVAPDGVTIVAGGASGRVHFLRLEGV